MRLTGFKDSERVAFTVGPHIAHCGDTLFILRKVCNDSTLLLHFQTYLYQKHDVG
eukprot:m.1650760 g.1650760  ORF g.1650760 m.1650760 type:complete len:55 (+) comp88209_c0_seq1:181-345(+)